MSARELSGTQQIVLGISAALMVIVGGIGGWGTYTNVVAEFGRQATAAGVVAAGEGLTLILALAVLGFTLLGQTSPAPVRIGLWLAPLAACGTGLALADTGAERAVYAITPLAMSGAAEGLGLIARRVVIYTTGEDAEADRRAARARRRGADTVRELAYQQAVAARHPDEERRNEAERKSWELAGEVGAGDDDLGAELLGVQRARIQGGADAALAAMYGGGHPAAVEERAQRPRSGTATAVLRARFAEMDPEDAILLAADARPDAAPGELAHLLGTYGLPVDAVAVALALSRRPAQYQVHRPDTPDAPQVTALPPVTVEGAVIETASLLGPDASAREIAEHLARHRRLVVTEPYVRTALSREAKRQQSQAPATPMEGGYA
ncbi:hypothetical protein [Streptomyces sp. SCSIO ZS0520]|uniref:hypothetical protein n=1 Tax=Streptomyces sp. SCSIO ZS0520 TaxID=2892996 RepID=UPI0021D90AE1|nr:hypothetical protein [Streptomyces sp. SCSIO ZS0520]